MFHPTAYTTACVMWIFSNRRVDVWSVFTVWTSLNKCFQDHTLMWVLKLVPLRRIRHPLVWHRVLCEPLNPVLKYLSKRGEAGSEFNKPILLSWEFASGVFSFSPTEVWFANWVTWPQRGSCQASGVFICCMFITSQPRAHWPSVWRPHEALEGTAAGWVSLEALLSQTNPGCEVIGWQEPRGHVAYYERLLLLLGSSA